MNARDLLWVLLSLTLACLGSGCGAETVAVVYVPADAGAVEACPVVDAIAPADAGDLPACEIPASPGTLEIVRCAFDATLAACIVRDDRPVFVADCTPGAGLRCVTSCPSLPLPPCPTPKAPDDLEIIPCASAPGSFTCVVNRAAGGRESLAGCTPAEGAACVTECPGGDK